MIDREDSFGINVKPSLPTKEKEPASNTIASTMIIHLRFNDFSITLPYQTWIFSSFSSGGTFLNAYRPKIGTIVIETNNEASRAKTIVKAKGRNILLVNPPTTPKGKKTTIVVIVEDVTAFNISFVDDKIKLFEMPSFDLRILRKIF